MAQKVKRYRVVPTRNYATFPIDMLRHDRCWPATELDSSRILMSTDTPKGTMFVELRGLELPTIGRWASFGWAVEYWDLTGWVPLTGQTLFHDVRKMEQP